MKTVGIRFTALLMSIALATMCPALAAADVQRAEVLGGGGKALSPAAVERVIQVVESGENGAAVTSDGALWMWGYNDYGQLGTSAVPSSSARGLPLKVMDGVKQVDLGGVSEVRRSFAAAVKKDGTLWTWGANDRGYLGNGTTVSHSIPSQIMSGVQQVSLGGGFGMALKDDGSVWVWGQEIGSYKEGSTTPVKVLDGAIQVATGDYHAAVLKSDGTLWTWGDDYYGQLGDGSVGSSRLQSSPVKVLDDVAQVALGSLVSAAIKTDGSLWVWGNNTRGQMGIGSTSLGETPHKVMDDVKQVSLGEFEGKGLTQPSHVMAVKSDGSLWAWGWNGLGVLGDGTEIERDSPVKVMDDVSSASAGDDSTIALKADGSVWEWGRSRYGWNGTSGRGFPDYDFSAPYIGDTARPVKVHDGSNWLAPISAATIGFTGPCYYKGKKVTPKPTVKIGNKTLKEGGDYSLSYSKNDSVGWGAAYVSGTGAYGGIARQDFRVYYQITSAALKTSSATYDGKSHKPTVSSVKSDSRNVSKADYKVNYYRDGKATADFKSAGTIEVHVLGCNDYDGGKAMKFTIGKAANSMRASAVAKTVKLPKGKKKLAKAATVKGVVKFPKKAQGAVTYARVAKGSAKCLKVDKKTGKVTVAKGTKVGTYKLKVNVKAAGNKNYKPKTQRLTLTVRVKKK